MDFFDAFSLCLASRMSIMRTSIYGAKKRAGTKLDPTRYRFQCNNLPLLDVLAELRYLVEEIANGPNTGLWYKCGSKVPPVLGVPTDAV